MTPVRIVARYRLWMSRAGGNSVMSRLKPFKDILRVLNGRLTKAEARLDVEFRGELERVTGAWLECRAAGLRVESLAPIRTA